MCWLCDDCGGELQSCQDCGRLICDDFKAPDCISAPSYVTASGDLFCSICGPEYDRADEMEGDFIND